MEIKCLPLGEISANCYMLSGENFDIVIDPGAYSESVAQFLLANPQKEKAILLTHSHFDHICGANQLRDESGAKIYISEKDAQGLFDANFSMASFFGIEQAPFSADVLLSNGDILKIGECSVKCIETAGHSPGSMCFLINDILFSGDTLFKYSIGRTDFPNSNHNDMLSSLKKLLNLPDETIVYSGHGEATTIGEERLYNPFLKNLV